MDRLLGEVLIARQPLVTAALEVVGYELLYRDDRGRAPEAREGVRATARVVVDGLLGLGGKVVAEGEDVYLNVPIALLLSDALLDVPPDGLVFELLEDVADVPDVRDALVRHRAAGFRLALDDVVPDDPRLTLVDMVDVVKVDVVASGATAALPLIRELARGPALVVAEKVEDPNYFERVTQAGAALVQGFFFTRPRAVRSVRPLGLGPGHLALLEAIADEDVDLRRVEQLIRSDLTLTDRFLRLVDVATGWRRVESVHHGLVMLGQRAVHRWVTLLVLSAIAQDAPAELLTVASARGRYCEVLEEQRGTGRRLEAFSLGMFSVLGDAGVLPDELAAALPVRPEVRDALQGEPGQLRTLVELQLAAEAADWERLVALGSELGIKPRELAAAHVEALAWSTGARAAATGASPPSRRHQSPADRSRS